MTASEHLQDLAQRYAQALVDYHFNPEGHNYRIMMELHETLNDVAQEVALENE